MSNNLNTLVFAPFGGKPSSFGYPSLMPEDQPSPTPPIIISSGRGNAVTKIVQVVDTETGSPLINTNVFLRDEPVIGGIPGDDGTITISAPSQDSVVVFSHVGYRPIERTIGSLGSLINLDSEAIQGDTAVVTSSKKKSNLWLIGFGVLGIFAISTLGSGGKKGKTGLNGTKSKKAKKSLPKPSKKSKKRASSKKRKTRKKKTVRV